MSVDLIKDLVFLIIFCQALQVIASRKSFASRCARARGFCLYGDAQRGVRQCVHPTSLHIVYFIPSSLPEKTYKHGNVVLGEKKQTGEDFKGPGFVRLL